jgi:hypothetical protein
MRTPPPAPFTLGCAGESPTVTCARMAEPIRNGDVVLVDGLGQGWVSASIALGARLRYGPRSPYARFSHTAIVYDAQSQDPDALVIVEATAHGGVHRAFLSKYESRCVVVHTQVEEHDFEQMKAFLDGVMSARERYGWVTYLGLTLYALTGTRLCLQEAGTAICSGLVCEALTRGQFIWTRPPYACTPADICADLDRLGLTAAHVRPATQTRRSAVRRSGRFALARSRPRRRTAGETRA